MSKKIPKSKIQNPKSRGADWCEVRRDGSSLHATCMQVHACTCISPKSKIQNPKSWRARPQIDARLVEMGRACMHSQHACMHSQRNAECRMQNPKSKIQIPNALRRGGSISSDHPGIRDAPSSDPLLHSCGGLQNFARPRRRILTRAEFCSGLRRIRVGGTRMQNPKSKASSAPVGRGSTQNPKSLFQRWCSARESSRISGFW